ncbi:hypothetical protein [uncultured Tenacibaculum sp.]|uniref:hypothetical protein n=1 Tax=uncultured Tenacibaculum sp. TaxID=174713 RepID=UPI00260167BC|nr:hypothetical protein [uncultured Tenacibaculum sp.]
MITINKHNFILFGFIFCAFFDEVLTFELGSIFITPLKLFSIILIFFYPKMGLKNIVRAPKILKFYIYLHLFILVHVFLAFYTGDLRFSTFLDRLIHIITAMLALLIIYNSFEKNKIDISQLQKVFLWVFSIEVLILFFEILTGRPFFTHGIVGNSPLEVRGFHADRIFLSEYIFIGNMILFSILKSKIIKYTVFFLSMAIVISSDSNTGVLLLSSCFLFYFLKDKVNLGLKVISVTFFFVLFTQISFIQKKLLSEDALIKSQERFEGYFGENMSQDNWRLYSAITLIENLKDKPTVLGEGFGANARFLSRKAFLDKELSAHSVLSIIYDYGLIGMFFICLIVFLLIKNIISISRINMIKENRNYLMFFFMFNLLIFSRFILYYQTTIVWIYVIGIAMISSFKKRLIKS